MSTEVDPFTGLRRWLTCWAWNHRLAAHVWLTVFYGMLIALTLQEDEPAAGFVVGMLLVLGVVANVLLFRWLRDAWYAVGHVWMEYKVQQSDGNGFFAGLNGRDVLCMLTGTPIMFVLAAYGFWWLKLDQDELEADCIPVGRWWWQLFQEDSV